MAEEDIYVGTRCILKGGFQYLNVIKGERGLCYVNYDDNETFGFIFQNGGFDGFSRKDISKYLEILPGGPVMPYVFTSAMNLQRHYDDRWFHNFFQFQIPEVKSDDINPMEGVYGNN